MRNDRIDSAERELAFAAERLPATCDNLRWRRSSAMLRIVWLRRWAFGRWLFERGIFLFYRLMILKVSLKIGKSLIQRFYHQLRLRRKTDIRQCLRDLAHVFHPRVVPAQANKVPEVGVETPNVRAEAGPTAKRQARDADNSLRRFAGLAY